MQLPDDVRAKLDGFAEAQERIRIARLDLELRAEELSDAARKYAEQLSGRVVEVDAKERVVDLNGLHEQLMAIAPSPRRTYVSISYSSETVVVRFMGRFWRGNTTVRGASTGHRERTFRSGCMGVYYPKTPSRFFLKSPTPPYETLELVRQLESGWTVVSETNWEDAGRAAPGSSQSSPLLSRR